MRPAPLALLLSGLAACAAASPERTPPAFAAVAALRAEHYPGAAGILRGFAPADDDPALRVGDAALLALAIRRDGVVERQLLLLEVTSLHELTVRMPGGAASVRRTTTAVVTTTPPDGEPVIERLQVHDVDVTMTRFDEHGNELASGTAVLFEEGLRAGFWPDTDPAADEADRRFASLLTYSLQNLANSEPTLQDVLFEVVDPPGLLSVAMRFGVAITVHAGRRSTGSTSANAPAELPELPGLAGAEVRVAPLDLTINGQEALWSDLLVVRPQGASMACGGLVGAIARHPREPDREAAVRLLATRRGAR